MGMWGYYQQCNKCGHRVWSSQSGDWKNDFHELCNQCGASSWSDQFVARWASDAVWWKPWTWLLDHFEKKGGE